MVNCETTEVLKNIRVLKTQIDMLMGIKTTKKELQTISFALENLSTSIKRFLE
ncbi:MAG: hypothetical protein ABF289_03695 [Clostridiales bacterium]